MEKILNWVKDNYEWLFGGIGATIVTGLIGFLLKKNNGISIKQNQKSRDNSTNTQIGQINNDKK